MLADTDAGNVVTGAQAGARWGYRLAPLVLLLIPMLYMVQELALRLGIFSRRGHAELIRSNFGPVWAWVSVSGLAIAVAGSLVTEFTGIAGVGEIYAIPRGLSLAAAVALLAAVAASGTYRRTERAALAIGLFELAFFAVAWTALRHGAGFRRDFADIPLGNRTFLYLGAAIVGAVFNPWMIFYQQSAVIHKGLRPADYLAARLDTAAGAVLTQLATAAVLVAAAATLGMNGSAGLQSVGAISAALTPVLGGMAGRLVFSLGVLGAAMVAAVVSSLALGYGLNEVAGRRGSGQTDPFLKWRARGLYAGFLFGCAALVWAMPNLVALNIAAQVMNVFLLPLVIGLLVALSLKVLPVALKPRGWYLAALLGVSFAVTAFGFIGGILGML